MLRSIVSWSLQFRYLVLIGALALAFFGVNRMRTQSVDILPEFAPLAVQVQTEALGLAPAEVESLITAPLEEILSGVPWLDVMESKSIEGLSAITLHFEEGTSLLKARQMVQERLLHTSVLPKVSKPPSMLQPKSDINRAMQIGLTSEKLPLTEVSLLARWKIKPRLMAVPGVSNVTIFGSRERQLQVEVDTEKLNAKGVQLQDVIKATGNALWVSPLTYLRASTPGNGGFIDTPSQRYDIRHVLPISTPEDLSRITFQAADGSTLKLGDVAKVVEGHQPLIGDGIVNGASGLMMVVEKLPGANTLNVTRGIEKAMEALTPGLPDVTIRPAIYRPATYVQNSLDSITNWLMIGLGLLALALFAMTNDLRAVAIAIAAMSLSMLTAWFAIDLAGVAMTYMVLTGLAIASIAVIDDAVVDVDHHRKRMFGGDVRQDATTRLVQSALDVRTPLLFATLIGVLLAFPAMFETGAAATLLKPVVLASLAALVASTLVAHLVTTVLCHFLYEPSAEQMSKPEPTWLSEQFERLMSIGLGQPKPLLAAAGLVTALGLAALAVAPKTMLPTLMERDLVVQWDMPAGTSHPAMSALVGEAVKKIKALPGVRETGGDIGRAVQSDRVAGVNSAELWVGLAADAPVAQTTGAIRQALEAYPGVRNDPQSFASLRITQAMDLAKDTLSVRLFGPRWDVLQAKSAEIQKALAAVPGFNNPRVLTSVESTNLKIEVDLSKAEKFGIKPGDVRRGVATLLAGIEVGSLYEEQKIFEVIVWGSNATRHNPAGISDLFIDTPKGGRVRLGDVADVKEVSSPTVINRYSASRYLDIVGDLKGVDAAAVAPAVKSAMAGVQLPLEFHTEIMSDARSSQMSRAWMYGSILAAALGIMLLLQALLGGWDRAMLAAFTIAASIGGAGVAAYLAGGPVTLGTVAGIAAVALIAIRQSILLMNGTQHSASGFSATGLVASARQRLMPVVTTALATVALFAPVIVMGRIAGFELVHPIAVSIIGGTIASALMTLVVLPSIAPVRSEAPARSYGASPRLVTEAGE